MDATRFDRFVQSLSAAGTRRGVLSFLTALPLAGALTALLGEGSDAAGRRKRRKKQHKHRQHRRHDNRKGKGKGKRKKRHASPPPADPDCISQPMAQTCAGQCGTVLNNCTQPVDCGACACDASSCAACEICQGDGVCSVPCHGSGCCDGLTCQPGDTNAACGSGGEACAACSGSTPLCVDGACASVPCTTNEQCPSRSLCDDGACRPCDVCASGCPFTSVQTAITAASAGDIITICAGDFTGNLAIGKNLTLIGAGNGDGAGDTILRGTGTGSVVLNTGAPVSLQRLRITGGNANSGGGIRNSGTLALTACTITGNATNTFSGGGIFNDEGSMTLDACTVFGNTSALNGGGIVNSGEMMLNDSTVGPNNTASANGGGIYNSCLQGETCTMTLEGSTVLDNTAPFNGGGIYNNPQGTVTLDADSHVTMNDADPEDLDAGGGIFNDGGTVNLSNEDNVTNNTPDNCGPDGSVNMCVDP